jgi:anti-anti-sigma regulatory factor
MAEELIHIGFSKSALVVAPEGHMTAALCPALSQRLSAQLKPDAAIESLHFDYSGCRYMDSTFLGLIVSLSKKAQSLGIGKPVVHDADAQCMSLFRTMGMTGLLAFEVSPCPKPESMETLSVHDALKASFILDAHRELMGLSPENEERFRTLAGALEDALREESELL